MTAPGPLASATTRPWVSGTPRALMIRRGRGSPAGATASTARASTSGRITMPGPPPAGVSSTERCLSVACARMATASSVHRPAASALPARLKPSGPGNISGKMVRMVARHMMLDLTDSLVFRFSSGAAVARRVFRRRHHDAPARDVDAGHEGGGEWHHDSGSPRLRPQFQDVACAEIVNRRHRADLGAVRGDGAKSDQIGVVELVGGGRRQTLAQHEQPEIGEPLCRVAIGDAAKARDQMTFCRAQGLDFVTRRADYSR